MMSQLPRPEPGSFKDPASRVFYVADWVVRSLSATARVEMQEAVCSGLLAELTDARLIVETDLVSAASLGLQGGTFGESVLRQPRLGLVTYPYEWSFEMLRGAALLVLDICTRALRRGFIFKDANAFNVQWIGASPRWVDLPSLVRHREGSVWAGYGQFCRSFLFPLLLASYRGVTLQPLLRGWLGEVPVGETARLLSLRDWLRPGVLREVVLQARLDRLLAASPESLAQASTSGSVPREAIARTLARLRRLVAGLPAPSVPSPWLAYGETASYSDDDRNRKAGFLAAALAHAAPGRVLDIGCNTGEYTTLAGEQGARVIAMDADSLVIDSLYRRLHGREAVWPLVGDLTNPSPAMGWELGERQPLLERVRSDFFLALALVHHLRISGGIPLRRLLPLLFGLAPAGIIEWVDRSDPMVAKLLALRPDVFDDYTWETFQKLLVRSATIVAVENTHGGSRKLCHVRVTPK